MENQSMEACSPIVCAMESIKFEDMSDITVDCLYQIAEDCAQYDIANGHVTLENFETVLQTRYRRADVEYFIIVHLDESGEIAEVEEATKGTIDGASIFPREIVKTCVAKETKTIYLVHNHPSGLCDPSEADKSITKKLINSLRMINIEVKDHIILGGHNNHSLRKSHPSLWES